MVQRGDVSIDFAPPWKRVTLRDAIRERSTSTSPSTGPGRPWPRRMGTEADANEGWGKLVDGLLSKSVEPELIQPSSTTQCAVRRAPLPRRGWSFVRAFAGGMWLTELNDPDEQRGRLRR